MRPRTYPRVVVVATAAADRSPRGQARTGSGDRQTPAGRCLRRHSGIAGTSHPPRRAPASTAPHNCGRWRRLGPCLPQANSLAKPAAPFYTPQAIATFLSQWAIRRSTDAVFEPSCGEAAFLTAAATRLQALGANTIPPDQLQGTDIDPASVGTAAEVLRNLGVTGQLSVGDFFDVVPERGFEAVIGNPPYVRYQAFAGAARAKGMAAALAQGVRLTGLTSSWAPFVVHATSFLTSDGRLALVLPAELLAVNYAAPVRRFLMQRFARVRLVLFEERVFPGVSEEVVLLLAEGCGPTDHCELHQAKNLRSLGVPDWKTWTPDNVEARWVTGLLPAQTASIYADLARGEAFSTLLDWGHTYLGMVTGNNRYFALTADRATELGLRHSDLLKIACRYPHSMRSARRPPTLGISARRWRDTCAAET